jgi:hypothetical protein
MGRYCHSRAAEEIDKVRGSCALSPKEGLWNQMPFLNSSQLVIWQTDSSKNEKSSSAKPNYQLPPWKIYFPSLTSSHHTTYESIKLSNFFVEVGHRIFYTCV